MGKAPQYTWSWADYEREKRAEERKAAKRAAALNQKSGEGSTADDTRGCEGRVAVRGKAGCPAPNVSRRSPESVVRPPETRQACPVPERRQGERKPRLPGSFIFTKPERLPVPRPGERIDISAAPSAMEASAERWRGASPVPIEQRAIPESQRNRVLCRCGGGDGKRAGLVPSWFGDKCIEGDCPLRGIAKRKVRA